MEIFGTTLNTLLFSFFLPFLLFYLLLYALLRKSKVLGESKQTNYLNTLLALTLSGTAILSLHSLGLTRWLPLIAGFTTLAAFAGLFVYGTLSYSIKKVTSYQTGEAFKTEEEKKFEKLLPTVNELWNEFFKAPDEKKPQIFKELHNKMKVLEEISEKLKKDLRVELRWYEDYKRLLAMQKGG